MEEKERRKAEMSSVLHNRRQFDFKTASRSPDMKESCYVCGASQAFWSLHSKPTGDDVPFFPFLEYHKPPCSQERLDNSGRVLACNVCYSFLVQQWDSYEATRTPILKRLYWLKRMNTDLSRSQSPATSMKSDSAADSSSEFNDREKYSLHPSEMIEEVDRTEERTLPSFRGISSLFGMTREISTSPGEENVLQGQRRNLMKDVVSLYEGCLLCGEDTPKSSLKAVHSKAQIKPDTPFYPFLQQLVAQGGNKVLDSQGKGNVCPTCYTNLFSQWQVFQANNTPVSERKYQFSLPLEGNQERAQDKKSEHEERMWPFKGEDATSCPLCGHTDPLLLDCQISAVKRNAKDPFYPFLKNLLVPMDEGWVNVCPKCKDVLDSTWMAYEMDGTATEDRIYQMHMDQEGSHSLIPQDMELVCFVCGKPDTRKTMKSAFSSRYANMNFEFLEKLEPRPGALFKKGRGEALICAGCYHSLKSQWVHFELHQVPLSSRKFQLHTLFRQEKHPKEKRGSEIRHLESCEVCEVECPVEATAWIEVFPATSEQAANNGSPFFPYLAKWKSRGDHNKLKVCKLCYANLQAQWNEYESLGENTTVNNPWKRKYRVHHFTCYGCGDSVHRTNICVVPRQDCKGYVKEGARFAVQLEEFIAMCSECKLKLHDSLSGASNEDDKTSSPSKDSRASTPYSPSKESYETSNKDDTLRNEQARSVDVCEDAGMKATATVPPLPTIMMGSQAQERGPTQNQGEDREGSFAAALRKLAQQALVPERGHMIQERPGGPKVSSSKASSHGRSTPSGTDSPSRRQSRQVLPGIFARPGPESFCASRDDHRSHGGDTPPRDMPDRHQPTLPGNNFSMAAFSAHGAKDRSSSNVGLVHPQPVRKLPEEEHGSKLLNSVRCPSRDPPSSVFRPPSPSEAFSRFGPFSAAVHSHGPQAPCPVHGHESGHRHGSPGEHGARPHGLPFEGLAGNGLSEIRPYHAHRFREDFYPLHRHGMEVSKAMEGPTYIRERKEPFAHHMMDEDLRRRGYDWPWPPMQPAFYDTEQYRRHLLSSFRSHDHPYKDVPHGQLYYSSLPYYGREFPLPVDPYLHPSLVGGTDPYQHRHGPPLSPRLAEYYRRTELGILDRPREPHEMHRHGDRGSERIKEERIGERGDRPRSSEDAKPRVEVRKHDIRSVLNHDKEKPKESLPTAEKREEAKSAGLNRGQGPEVQDFRKLKPQTSPKKPMLFPEFSLLPPRSSDSPRSTLVDQAGTSRTETKPFTSRIDFSIAGPKFLSRRPSVFEEDVSKADLDAEMRELNDESAGSDDVDSNGGSFVADESEDKDKMNYMNCLGLVPHGKRRALEEDYERRRWERKFRKIRGRPRKRIRRETNDESDSRDRPGSELDFYTGPMTRHKQQLLQEQESLLEQIQRSKEDMDDEQDNRTDELLADFDSSKGLSPSLDQNSPRRSFLMATSCHAPNKIPQPLSIDTASIEAAMKNSSQKGPSESSGLLTLYRRTEAEKCKAVEQRGNFPLGERPSSIKSEETQSFSSYLRERTNSLTPRGISQGSRWLGVEEVTRSYTAYRQDQEVEESLLRRAFERLKGDEEMLNHQSQQLKKDMMVLHEVKVKVGDERQKLKWTMENLHQVMRTIAAS